MENNQSEIELEDVINELNNITYTNIAEKAEQGLDEFYLKFKEQFGVLDDGADADIETKKEMIIATYSMALESLNNSLNLLEYSYLLTLAIDRINDEENLQHNDYVNKAIITTNSYIKRLAVSADLKFHDDVANILKDLQEKRDIYE